MKIIFNTDFLKDKSHIIDLVNDFDISGIELGNQKRNTIKLFNIGKKKININHIIRLQRRENTKEIQNTYH